MSSPDSTKSFFEFVALMALMISLAALSIDAMLPALSDIGADLAVENANDLQLIITVLFAGMAIGQLIYGPFSDSYGRKPAIYLSIAVFIVGSLCALLAQEYRLMLIGRFLQGLGAAGPRIVSIALVRDQHKGRDMARVMSFIMSVFILVPVFAPALGQIVLFYTDWRAIFLVLLLLAVFILCWFAIRQTETLTKENRVPLSLSKLKAELSEVFSYRTTVAYGVTSGLIFGALVGYLSSIQAIFQVQYQVGVKFAFYFGVIALAIGLATLINSKLVMRLGMHFLCRWALICMTSVSMIFYLYTWAWAIQPNLWLLIVYFSVCFFCIGILFGNLNALAMEPLGHIAGIGSAVIGSLGTFIAVPIGIIIGHHNNGTVLPLVLGFTVLSLMALLLTYWGELDLKSNRST